MSEEQTEQVEQKEEKKELPVPKETREDETTEKVEMDDKTQKRFNRIYHNMKQNERFVAQLMNDQKVLLKKLDTLEGQQQKQAVEQAVEGLKARKAQALDAGDHKQVVEIDDQIAQVRAVPENKPEPKQEAEVPAVQIPEPEKALLRDWANELTPDGNFKRPWAQAGHPYNAKAAAIGAAVLEDPEFDGKATEEVLREIDRLMGAEVKQLKRTSPVLSNDSDVAVKKSKETKLSTDQKKIAEAIYSGEKPETAHARYLKGLQMGA